MSIETLSPVFYTVDIEVDGQLGSSNMGSITIDTMRPCTIVQIRHCITQDAQTTRTIEQDGRYRIDLTIGGRQKITRGPGVSADLLCGRASSGDYKDVPGTLTVNAGETLEVSAINTMQRDKPIKIQVVFVCVERKQ
jgi:hypothetical protein